MFGIQSEEDMGFVPYADDGTAEQLEAAIEEAFDEMEVPDEGYFDYDESWFDPED